MVVDSLSSPVRAALRLPRHDVVVTQMALGSYRAGLLRALEATRRDIRFLVGDEHFGRGVVTDVSSPLVRRTGRNVFALRRRIGWQRGCVVRGLLARTLVVELNPRNLTTWLLLGARWLTGRRTAGWGHAHSRRGPARAHNRVRRLMQGMCSELIAYTETEARELRGLFPRTPVLPARNALYSAEELTGLAVGDACRCRDVLMIGRIVPEKKVLLGVRAFHAALDMLPADAVLHVVGTGPEEQAVRDLVAATGLEHRVRFHGYLTDLHRLAPVFGRCRALLAPGYIGLNATQALGFGLPVLYARDEPHSPEIEALDASNSIAVTSDDVDALALALAGLYTQPWPFDSARIAAAARAAYSTDRMIEPFVRLGSTDV
jgi:glycosyltransferase involved in cell wall biosynthesis